MSYWDYTREETERKVLTGKMRCVIVEAAESVSKKTGNPMIVVTVKPSGSNARVKQYIPKGEYFNRNMTQFYDAFPSIKEGTFNFMEWVGAEGAANFGEDENGYLKIKWFISADQAKNLPPFEGDKPEQQTVTSLDDEDDELPFDVE